jgi:hypothetical protein
MNLALANTRLVEDFSRFGAAPAKPRKRKRADPQMNAELLPKNRVDSVSDSAGDERTIV